MLISFSNLKRKYNMDIKGIIHIGAHYGEEIVDYIDEGIQNIVVFEPLNDNFDIPVSYTHLTLPTNSGV